MHILVFSGKYTILRTAICELWAPTQKNRQSLINAGIPKLLQSNCSHFPGFSLWRNSRSPPDFLVCPQRAGILRFLSPHKHSSLRILFRANRIFSLFPPGNSRFLFLYANIKPAIYTGYSQKNTTVPTPRTLLPFLHFPARTAAKKLPSQKSGRQHRLRNYCAQWPLAAMTFTT